MSDPQVAEGPGVWSPAAPRGPARGVGDGLGVEGSQAAASGTKGWGAGGWVPSGLGAPHLGARLGRALPALPGGVDRPGQPLRAWSPCLRSCPGPTPPSRDPLSCHLPGLVFARNYFQLLFRNVLVPAPFPFLDQPGW